GPGRHSRKQTRKTQGNRYPPSADSVKLRRGFHGSSFFFSFSPLSYKFGIAGPEGAKNPAGKSPPPDSNPLSTPSLAKISPARQAGMSGRSDRHRPTHLRLASSQLFISTHNVTLSVT